MSKMFVGSMGILHETLSEGISICSHVIKSAMSDMVDEVMYQ